MLIIVGRSKEKAKKYALFIALRIHYIRTTNRTTKLDSLHSDVTVMKILLQLQKCGDKYRPPADILLKC